MTLQAEEGGVEAIPEGFEPVFLGSGYGELFGRMYKKKAEGDVRYIAFRAEPHHMNHHANGHGGATAFLADMQLAAVKDLLGNDKQHFPTKNLMIDFIAPITLGAWVEMEVQLLRVTRSSVYTQGVVRVDGRCVARATASYHVPQEV